ncbi:MAG TPA: hypothetical protein PKE29_03040 [Phycisphaerales bacterium]|nr:hypothetical protein [Phycisphaerales bacterium]
MEKRLRARLRVCALRWLWCALVFTAAGGEASGQPANDDCAQAMAGFAIPPGGGTVAGTLAGATRDATGTTCPGNQSGADVYHTITPTITGSYTFETCGLAAWDTVLSVHTGCPASVANQLPQACSDDLCGAQSRVGSVLLIAGRTYIVRVGAYASASVVGPYSLLATFAARAPNDECGAGNPLLMLDVPVATGNQGASTTITIDPASLCGGFPGSGGGADIFYRFKPPTSGGYTVSTCGSAIDTVVSVHSGCPVGESNLVGCNDDGPGGLCSSNALNSLVYVTLTAGREYFVRVAGYRYPDASGAPRVGSLVVLVRRDPNAIVLGACCGGATGGPACEIRAPGGGRGGGAGPGEGGGGGGGV